MSRVRPWAFWRRVQYGTGFFVFIGMIAGGVYLQYFYTPDSCFDATKNGDERAVDCGGSCVRICVMDVAQPKVVWAKSFEITKGQYNAMAYVENSNGTAATPRLKYTLQLFYKNQVVAERTGITILPPNSVYPIFEGRIQVNAPEITETKLTLEPAELWLPATLGREQFTASNLNLIGADNKPRLDVKIENTSLAEAKEVEVVATLFNEAGEPLTASQTFIEALGGRSTKDVVFTWPNSIAKTVRSCIIPTDVVLGIDLSGSMNNDGGAPPQPVTSALAAAKNFVLGLNKKDQASVVTFASDAAVVQALSTEHAKTASLIESQQISAEAETGYTNTSAAFQAAAIELASARHNPDARRVLVLLTDGLPTAKDGTADPIEAARSASKSLTQAGVEVYVIGLGQNVDLDFLSTIVEKKTNAYHAPTPADLAVIYKEITSSLCESGTARIDVIAKTPTSFPPLEPYKD